MDNTTILPEEKRAGVGMHITSLSSRYGIGDIGDSAQAFITKLANMKIAVWQFLPTGPTSYGDSPYQPLSAFAGNEMLIGIEPLIRLGLLTSAEADVLTGFPSDSVDYGNLIPRKQAVLRQAAARFLATADNGLKTDYENFLHLNGDRWLNDYAIYRVLKSHHGERPWSEWDAPFRHRDPVAMKEVRTGNRDAIESIKINQFLFDRQWQSLKRHAQASQVLLFGDMPIYIALDSSDAWAHPEILLIDENGTPSHVAGVPPDYFSEDGQLWGNPLYDWGFHEASGFEWWIERMHHAANQSDLVRIDHFRGLESFWSIPFGAETARNGEWIDGPGDGLFTAMKAALGSLPIVAEDLGVITAEVDRLRQRHHMPGMKVLQFEVGDASFNIDLIADNCVCYTGTHDNDTTVGWFNGGEQDTRSDFQIIESQQNTLRATGGTAESVHLDMIRLAFESRARLSIAPMQDFLGLGSEARLNSPGTTQNNWRWRVSEEQLSPHFSQSVANLVEETARA
jgi:4-alpha-glucanotransferase